VSTLPSYDEFRGVLGSTFTVAAVVDPDTDDLFEVDLRLHAISDRAFTRVATTWALEFRGPGEWSFEQGIASLDHAQFGRIDLFLVPIGTNDGEMAYEAVFTLLPEPELTPASVS
jgi:hypothetical protein